jgi:oligopeptide transport system permease protein
MFRFIARRVLETIPVLLIVATMTFFMLRFAPGGPFLSEKKLPPEIEKQLQAAYGLDRPLYEQYFRQLGAWLSGDFGVSTKHLNRRVSEVIAKHAPVSAELALWSMLIALGIGLPAGILASYKPNTMTDYVPMAGAMAGICIPTFVLGPLLALSLGLWLGWFDPSGWNDPKDRVLPALTLGLHLAAYIARLTRGGMLEIMSQDFIRTARAKGASATRIMVRHALRGGLLPVISYLGPAIAGLITGSFVVETVFNIPGLGRYFVGAAFDRDSTMVVGTVLFYAVLVIGLNLVVDIVLVWLNPKLRFE